MCSKTRPLSLSLSFSQTEPSVIGGMVVEIGDKYIDMATSTKIKKIVKTLNESLLQ